MGGEGKGPKWEGFKKSRSQYICSAATMPSLPASCNCELMMSVNFDLVSNIMKLNSGM